MADQQQATKLTPLERARGALAAVELLAGHADRWTPGSMEELQAFATGAYQQLTRQQQAYMELARTCALVSIAESLERLAPRGGEEARRG